jgi:quinol monooxygenase YgiN
MYGLIGKFLAHPGKRDELLVHLGGEGDPMPGCLSYIIAIDPADAEAIWITEVWTDKTAHQASLQIPAVKAAIAKAMPLIAGFGDHIETVPVRGAGLPGG